MPASTGAPSAACWRSFATRVLIFLIARFQKAALLMLSDQLVEASKGLNVPRPSSGKRFKRSIRSSFEGFLRFTHRYWLQVPVRLLGGAVRSALVGVNQVQGLRGGLSPAVRALSARPA